jgi:SAM-dependent methyltransferase
MNIKYIALRTIRHFLPETIVRALLLRGWIIKPASETTNIQFAVARYRQALEVAGLSLEGRRVLVLGYGGRFDVAQELLTQGAGHVVLVDPFAPPDDKHNLRRLGDSRFFQKHGARLVPDPQYISLVETDTGSLQCEAVDIVVSNSVLEHVDDVESVIRDLVRLTKPDGAHVHVVDLRDHYFRYPFEFLTFGPLVWKRLLNPSSNLNRMRLWGYREIFGRHFRDVSIEILERQEEQFEKARAKIRPQFISGGSDDSVTQIRILARPMGRVQQPPA